MSKITITLDDEPVRDVQLVKERTTLGRRPFNDVVLENLAVSGQHACLIQHDLQVLIEDLDSTNGTYVNGRSVKKQKLQNGDTVEIGKFKIKFVDESESEDEAAGPQGLTVSAGFPESAGRSDPSAVLQGYIKVVSGAAIGRELPLTKTVTTFGKPGVAVAAITRSDDNYFVHHVEGVDAPLLNGTAVGKALTPLQPGDQVTLNGTILQFFQR
ncbi:FHA domain-containing protein [Rhodoferax sp.]|uniref:FHA domain-containing protein n=1 Tax=Rhodoferax sp. TaxID=50421 RepID=UPI0008B58386|nr:FHA domain-containing protein [Rhodoferax sp.]OGB41335.1 MAG: hypothetical protein A2461_07430 [Burkholderiales bacterium RIFOXYC2_FULL_59_8]OGB54900.1 MAG: hypothetical protein A2503_00570 [Burkholderiales bacterium RIFOXYD12_FULL_59_19]OGB81959.1 MAG: hypothetical protein A2496_22135 [Burkholderiales bacterium RIFOXYC12_FULL_60_6]OGB86844.1 MAG: hypothetical protein A2535_11295 [Burkholderiales bacterium RIFOXYD2_FULL_59_8]MDO8320394.1 FHA domain-containing protein [Rhodoferax sp.]